MTSGDDRVGVFYRREDYIGVGRRLLIDFVDAFVATVTCLLVTIVLVLPIPNDSFLVVTIALCWVIGWFAYFVLLNGGPANFLIDLLWISSDPSRQAIRDKFAHTYVVGRNATPEGSGRIVYRTYIMLGTTFLFQEVQMPTASVR